MAAPLDLDRLRHGPILSTLLRLSVPNIVAMAMTVLVSVAETFYVGRLGTTPLAALGLVFPFAVLTSTMSGGAMGGGVSSAIARAFGAADPERARTLAMHAILIGFSMGAVYTSLFLLFGPFLYRALGGSGAVLAEAVRYATVLFSGALLVWVSNTLASVLRGTGNMRVPSAGIVGIGITQALLGGLLAFGAGPVPGLGMVGVALGHVLAHVAGVAFFAWCLMGGKARLTLRLERFTVRRELLADILRVGALACLSPLQTVLTMLVFTALVARVGEIALAGYSIGQRLEFLVTTISFGVGVASVPMVGMAIGGGDVARARRVAWTAGAVAGVITAAIGLLVAVFPDLWARMFSREEAVLEVARQYLRIGGPAFALMCAGLTLYFSSQGAGKMLGPVMAGTMRLAVAGLAGLWLASRGAPAWQYFALAAAAMTAYGLSMAAAVRFTRWGPKPAAGAPAVVRRA
ncbi:MAG TPA: MATE family efflux transporter [Quisquiliibacterium sp.]|nr:MATE family efflux transporter [Quisquiliibacterium sp.]